MAGTATPALAAAVSNAGGLGSLGLATVGPEQAREMIAATRAATARPFQVNFFCHQPAAADTVREAAWLERLAPLFARFNAQPPARLRELFRSFLVDDEMFAMLLAERPPIVSFHFGLPSADRIAALRQAGIVLIASATNLADAQKVAAAGLDAVVAQGYEAGGHRGAFDVEAPDDQLGTLALTRVLVRALPIPVIAAGGIMDGAGIAAALALGASAAQLGTAFVACPESSADAAFRAALLSPAAHHTVMVAAISGRPARCLANRFTAFAADVPRSAIPPYPNTYDAGKALNAAAKAAGEHGFGAQWAGQAAPLARALPAAELVAVLRDELRAAQALAE